MRSPAARPRRLRGSALCAALALAPLAAVVAIAPLGTRVASAQTGQTTTVAALQDSRFGARIVVYETADLNSPAMGVLANGRNVFGRVVFTVVEAKGEWLKVNAPIRPGKGAPVPVQGWIKATDVTSFQHPYSMVISVSQRTLTTYKGSQVILSEKVGVGKPATPTPLGQFYIVDLVKPKNQRGSYGPFAYGLSGFSEVYQSFGSGDGRIGLHGTNEPKSIGQNGTNGCIRISNTAITKLKGILPLGVPVNIVA